ncbi:unnamed protein product, partial [Vitis vinifera]
MAALLFANLPSLIKCVLVQAICGLYSFNNSGWLFKLLWYGAYCLISSASCFYDIGLQEIAKLTLSKIHVTLQVFKSGPLFISSKGIGWTSWKKRWFILTRTSLVFFRSDPVTKTRHFGKASNLEGRWIDTPLFPLQKPPRKCKKCLFARLTVGDFSFSPSLRYRATILEVDLVISKILSL